MQQQNLTNAEYVQSMCHEAKGLAFAQQWVVDSKRLEPGKYSVAMAHSGCVNECCAAPAVHKKD